MPIVTVSIVADPHATGPPPADRARRLADALGDVFGTEPGRTWVRTHDVPSAQYAENGTEQSDDVRPVFVEVLHATLGPHAARREQAGRIAAEVADVLDRPRAHVHVLFLPEARGRIAFGGVLADPGESNGE